MAIVKCNDGDSDYAYASTETESTLSTTSTLGSETSEPEDQLAITERRLQTELQSWDKYLP